MKTLHICPKCHGAVRWDLVSTMNGKIKCSNCGHVVTWEEWKNLETVEAK